jgi:hypothetical protein
MIKRNVLVPTALCFAAFLVCDRVSDASAIYNETLSGDPSSKKMPPGAPSPSPASNQTPGTANGATPPPQAGLTAFDFCWRDSKGRGVGKPLSTNSSSCPAGTIKDPTGLLCYPACKAGYNMVGPVCWQACPAGFTDTGTDCTKPAAYGRGAGYAWQAGDKAFDSAGQFSRCQHDNSQGCEQPGGGITLVYPKCKVGFNAVGTNICSPACPAGMTDIGVGCQKNSYGNTAGQVLGCSAGLERSGLLCYTPCGANADGVGPDCWNHCPAGWVQCGAGCAQTTTACATNTTNQVISVLTAAVTIASEVLTAGATAGIVDATKMGTQRAADQAADMVGKLHLSDAVSKFPKNGIDSSVVAKSVAAAMKPTKLTVATKIASTAGNASNFISTVVGVSNNATLTPDQKNMQIAQAVLNTASLVDPTGIAGVVAAYTKPSCSVVTEPTKAASSFYIDGLDHVEQQKRANLAWAANQ